MRFSATRDLLDSCLWVFAVGMALFLRYEFTFELGVTSTPMALAGSLGLANFALARIFSLRRALLRIGSFDELLDVGVRTFIVVSVLSIAVLTFGPAVDVPRSTLFLATPIYLFSVSVIRVIDRLLVRFRNDRDKELRRLLVYGAGPLGELIASQLKSDTRAKFAPVGFIDDSESKIGGRLVGLKVYGAYADLERVATQTGARAIVVALPSTSSGRLDQIRAKCNEVGLEVFVVSDYSSFLLGEPRVPQIRELRLEDLIGRGEVEVDSAASRLLIQNKVVLITGAGGSIGTELCLQVAEMKPSRLVLLDRDESSLQAVQLALDGTGLFEGEDVLLADIRDADRIDALIKKVRPEVVIHAAALKHLTLLERFPEEAWKTNVLGTANVLSSSYSAGVKRFVNISTDKAADPSSVLGRSKLVAEKLTAWYSDKTDGGFASVRFGNVVGSRGSLVPVLETLITSGRPVRLTDPKATRYFMSLDEACKLVLQAATEIDSRAVFVLDMGSPVSILEIAEKMMELSGKSVPIEYTGLRLGEKLHETVTSTHETLSPTSHPLVWKTFSDIISPRNLRAARLEFFLGAVQDRD